jgi:hypothetical protein
MVQEYQPRRFFRNAPIRLLQRYFAARNVLSEVDFGSLTETQVEPIYEAWLKLSDDARKEMEQDFQDIDELATEGGSKAILDEARWFGEDLAEQFASLTGFHEHAFWTILERPKYWPGALAFHHADAVPFSYWRKRKNVPRKPASVDALSIRQLEQNLSNYFHKMQGRGENCKVTATSATIWIISSPTRKITRRRAWNGWARNSNAARITPPSRSSSFTRRVTGRWTST